ncbi:type II toxin-antitoxin system RelE/ParE family toxin [Sulfitobacter pontiacus]|uniref:type II toxin-antitoxin system RelE/ParE family toxin n=1 Tax=Sulfitobacter pontiacus TaxID=60137 RepID=UPI0030EC6C38
MKVIITQSAEDSLREIYRYKCEYSVAHADEFLSDIYAFTTENLSQFPRLGHVYNPERDLFRLIYTKAFNIYYTIREQEVFVLFIIDGSISLNQELSDPTVTLPEL